MSGPKVAEEINEADIEHRMSAAVKQPKKAKVNLGESWFYELNTEPPLTRLAEPLLLEIVG